MMFSEVFGTLRVEISFAQGPQETATEEIHEMPKEDQHTI